jgi:hypothetical protein
VHLYVGCANLCPRAPHGAASEGNGFAVKSYQQKSGSPEGCFLIVLYPTGFTTRK